LELEDITYSDDENDVGAEVDFNNLETSITISPIPTTRIHKDHLVSQIIGDLSLTTQTRSMTKVVKDQGHTQEERIDYEEVFAPVERIEAIILFLAYASLMGFMVYQMDVKSAFQYGTIEEEVYIYVDDIIFGATNKDLCKSLEKLMKDKFQMSSMGELIFFLGLQVKQKKDGIFINQDKYVAEVLRKFGLTKGKSASTPIDTEKPLLKDSDDEDVDVHTYMSMIGSLMYLTSSRPDIMFASEQKKNKKEAVVPHQGLARKNKLKARGTLLMALPDKHQSKFNIHKDAKTFVEAIEKRFGGNKETKKDSYPHLEEQSLDDLFNSLKIYEAKVKSSSSASTSTQNIAFVSSQTTDSTNDPVSVVSSVSASSVKIPVSALPNVDTLSNVRTERNIGANRPTSMGFDMSKVKCYNCHRKGYFARECRSPKDTRRNDAAEPQRRNVLVETSTSNALVSQYDGVGSYDWSFQAEEKPTNYAIMAFTASSSSSSDNELRDNALVVLRQKFEKAEERDDLKLKLENDESVPPSPIYDRYQSGDGYHVVPPTYTGSFMPPKPDLVFHNAPNDNETVHTAFNVELSPTKHDNDLPSVKAVETCIPTATTRTAIPKPKSNGNRRNRKACFVSVLTKSKLVLITAARPVNNDVLKPHVTRPRPVKPIVTKPYSPPRRHINRSLSSKASNFPPKVTAVKVPQGNPQHALKDKGVIDSRCSRHITGNISYLSDFKELNGRYIAFGGNPKGGKISGKGKIKTGKLDFDDFYFVKKLKFNLFSVSQMCDEKNSVLFTDTECLVLSPEFKLLDKNQVLLKIARENNMYNVDLKNIVPSGYLTCLFAKATLNESNLWHRRQGHINFKIMIKLVKGNLVRGLPIKVFENDHTCIACKKEKQHRASCKTKPVSAVNQPLQRLHMDLFGPTFVKSLNKKSYYLVVTDEFSRFTWVFFLATKDETSPILKTFITSIENQLSLKVNIIKSDNETEFKNNDLNQLCGMKGIKREFSVPRTPQQNGIVKRKNKTLIEAVRTMLADSLLPILFWAEVVNTVCYVHNSVLVTKPQNKTPYELLLGRTPSIGFMRPFGCTVTILNTLDPLGRFDGKVDEGFLVGYSVSSKVFRNTDGDAAFEVKELEFEGRKPESEVHVFPSSSAHTKKHGDKTKREAKGKSHVESSTGYRNLSVKFEDFSDNSINVINVADSSVPAVELEDMTYSNDEEDVGAEADFTNLETTITVSPIPITRVHKDHPVTQIIGDLSLATQTRSMTRVAKDQGGLSQINNDDFHTCMFACFLSQEEPKREEGIDYEEVLAPVEEVYVSQPLGFEDPDHPDKVYKVVKIYVDDIIFGSTNKDLCKAFEKLMKDLQMSSMGELILFLGLQVKQKEDGIFISQDKYVAEILRKFGLRDGKSASTPIDTEKPLLKDPDGEDVDVHTYRSMIGSLMYLTSSRSDIMFAVCACAHFQVTPKASHLHAVKRIFRYFKGNPHLGLWYPKDSPFNLVAYSDSDYAEGIDCLPNEEIFAELSRMRYDSVQQVDESTAEVNVDDVPAVGVADEGAANVNADVVLTAVDEPIKSLPTPATPPPPPSQDVPSTSQRVKKLEMRNKLKVSKLRRLKKVGTSQRVDTSDDTVMDDISKQGRIITSMDADVNVTLKDVADIAKAVVADAVLQTWNEHEEINDTSLSFELFYRIGHSEIEEIADVQRRQAESQAQIYQIDLEYADKLITKVVTAASATPTVVAPTLTTAPSAARRRKRVVIRDLKETATPSTIIHTEAKSKDKGKGILVEKPKPLKKQAQIEQDEAFARKLEAELNKTINWDDAIDQVQRNEKKDNAMDYFKGMKYDDIHPIFEKYFNSNMAFLEKTKEQMEEEEDSRALKRISESQEDKAAKKQKLDEEVPVVNYIIHTENNKPYFKIIRADGTHQLILSFRSLLRNFNREDLEVLWELVKESFGVDAAKDFKEIHQVIKTAGEELLLPSQVDAIS
nr:putative ribonuclease H-like domain-containing protein [Tanacetum cinerariifolium]